MIERKKYNSLPVKQKKKNINKINELFIETNLRSDVCDNRNMRRPQRKKEKLSTSSNMPELAQL